MKKKTLAISAAILFFAVMVLPLNAYAMHCKGGEGFKGGHSEGARPGGGLEGKFFMKAHMILENADELELSADKVKAIKQLKVDTKKMLIKQDAEIEVAELDIEAKLHEQPIDVKALEKMIDQKYELKKAKAKNLIEALAKVKGMLSKEQSEKMHTLWKSEKKEESNESH